MVASGAEASIVCGDVNIAPTDADVFDPDAYVGQTHVTAPERAALAAPQAAGPRGATSTAPADPAVCDPAACVGQTHVTAPERAALAELQALGLRDVVRDHWPDQRAFTSWDYPAGQGHHGL